MCTLGGAGACLRGAGCATGQTRKVRRIAACRSGGEQRSPGRTGIAKVSVPKVAPLPVKSVTAAHPLSPGPGSPVSLWRWLARLPDPRDRRGVRFTLACVIAVAIAARLAGCDSFTAIGEWAASRPQRVLKALGCPLSKRAGVYIAPSEKTVRRVAGPAGIDHDLAGDLLCGWTAELAAACEIFSPAQLQQQRRDAARKAKAQAPQGQGKGTGSGEESTRGRQAGPGGPRQGGGKGPQGRQAGRH